MKQILMLILLSAVVNNGVPAPQNLTINPIGIYPHDTSSFTQGLQIYNGKLYEGAGDFENLRFAY